MADILSLEEIIKELSDRVGELQDCIIFSGTVPLVDDYVYGEKFYLELIDNVLGRKITTEYSVNIIPEVAR